MTTEVQIRKSLAYLPHLRKIVSCIAARLGMSRSDIEATEMAVSEACSTSIDKTDDSQGNLSVKLATHGDHLTVEITDPCIDFDPICTGEWLDYGNHRETVERIRSLMDGVELISGDEGTTIRITKYARKLEPVVPAAQPHHAPVLGATILNA